MRLKEQISDAQRFVQYSLITVCDTCPRGGVHRCVYNLSSFCVLLASLFLFVGWLVLNTCNFLFFRSNIQENVDLIKLQRDMKEKATKFEALQVKYLNLEEVRYQ